MEQTPTVPVQPVGAGAEAPGLPGVSQLIKEAWEIYKQRFWTMLGIVVVPAILAIVGPILLLGGASAGLAFRVHPGAIGGGSIVGLIIFIVAMIAAGVWSEAALITNLANKEENIGIQKAYSLSWGKIGSLFWANLLAGLAIAGGFILLIIPGIIFMVWFSQTSYVNVLEGLKGSAALSKSKSYVAGRWWDVFGRLILIVLLAVIISGLTSALTNNNESIQNLISFLLAPYFAAYGMVLYRGLKRP